MKYTFFDLFAGIGGTRIAFEKAGAKCVFTCEWDKFSKITYKENFNEVDASDVRGLEIEKIPDHDILIAGFPCQPFSIAGVSKKNSLGELHGFKDRKQGNLFFQIARILDGKRPKAFLLENVKNLKYHNKKRTLEKIIGILEELNYSFFYEVLDGKYYVPQHRERIYIAGFNKDFYEEVNNFYFPEAKLSDLPKIKDILLENIDDKYTLSDHLWKYLQDYAEKHRKRGNGFGFGLVDPDIDSTTRTLSARYHKDGSEILIKQADKNPRRLTPRECARLMGFNDGFKIPVSDTQAYRQFGNSVVVPLVEQIAKKIIEKLTFLDKKRDTT